LLTHTPGFEDYVNSIFSIKEDDMLSLEQYVKEYLPKRVFPAGEVAAYSNYGTALAGYIIEQVTGKSFSDYIEEKIYLPLQMQNSSFEQPLPTVLEKQMTQSYRYVNDEFLEGDFE